MVCLFLFRFSLIPLMVFKTAPRPVKAQPKPVKPKTGGRNKKVPGTSAVPLEKAYFKGAKRAAPSVERRAELWEHVQSQLSLCVKDWVLMS